MFAQGVDLGDLSTKQHFENKDSLGKSKCHKKGVPKLVTFTFKEKLAALLPSWPGRKQD